jgi:hypothetical protein
MLHKKLPAIRLAPPLAAACLALLGPGCQHEEKDQMTQAVISGERPVAMAGSESFFGGRVTARVTISRGIGRGAKGAGSTSRGGSGSYSQDRANDKIAREAYESYANATVNNGSPLPPVTLHLILINPGSEPLIVTIVDFESDLGNFAVDPDTLTVLPGETGEPAPMVSLLGVSSNEIPVKVTLRMGAQNETHTVTVRSLLDDSGKPRPAAP